ncbi:MAG TPA: hypothetical protein VKU00_12160 [Chthonomonadaceae bacterium]|nr:hypothetical protein [Chthonomonadaceae bacterium]
MRNGDIGMEAELTLGDIYEEISERLALARTKALMGERQEALGLFQGASLDYTRFRDVLAGYPGAHALEHAFDVTMAALDAERAHRAGTDIEAAPIVSRTRRRARKAA